MAQSDSNATGVSRVATASLVVSFGVLLACIAAAIFFLPLMSFLGVAMLIGAALFSLLVAGHYVVWGWWIHRILDDESTAPRDADDR